MYPTPLDLNLATLAKDLQALGNNSMGSTTTRKRGGGGHRRKRRRKVRNSSIYSHPLVQQVSHTTMRPKFHTLTDIYILIIA